jgi:3-deoxy-D-manno-octulosonate 8-phosphate phosphatase (KDO 8-P phosphatase)
MSPDYLSDLPSDVRERAARVRLVGLDVDGTLSDGRLWFTGDGKEIKAFSVLDGLGMKLLRDHGVEVALITARESPIVQQRARELGLRHVYQGARDKLDSLKHLCHALSITPEQVAYMGDDLPDLPVLRSVGLAVAPPNAHPWVRRFVHWSTRAGGGEGAVRELCDAVLLAQGKADAVLRRYLPA